MNISGLPNAYSHEQPWRRSVLLLREGPMIVIDRFRPDIEQDGWLAGPTWLFGRSHQSAGLVPGQQPKVNITSHGAWLHGTGFESTEFRANKSAPWPMGKLDLILRMRADGGKAPAYGVVPGASAQTCYPYGPAVPNCPAVNPTRSSFGRTTVDN